MQRKGQIRLVLLTFVLAAFAQQAVRAAGFPAVGKPAVDFNLETHLGTREALSKYKGKVVIINFGSKDTEKEAIALFNSMAKYYVTKPGIQILSTIVLKNLPFYANKQTVLTRVEEIAENSGFPKIPRLLDWEGKMGSKYGVNLGPNLLVVDKKGKVVYMQGALGKGTSRALNEAVAKALAAK